MFNLCLHHTGARNLGASLLVLHPDNRGAKNWLQTEIEHMEVDLLPTT